MARMIPVLSEEQLRGLRSRAEARFYEACRDQLPSDIVAIHSVGWIYRDQKGRVREGEADFTLLVPSAGVFAVEVKGGGVAHDTESGKWYSVDRGGVRHEIKDPFRQASNERHALLAQLNGHATWRQWKGRRLTIGHAVMLPDIADSLGLQSPDRPRNIIGVAADLQELRMWLQRLVSFWRQEHEDPLGAQGVRIAEEILCRSIDVRPVLRSALDDAETHRIRLTANQAKILRIIGGRKRAVIAGGAGTGKTLLAVEKARQFASAGKEVLLLCYNRPLADALASGLQGESKISVLSFHQLCDARVRRVKARTGRDLLDEAADAFPGQSDKHVFEVQFPYALALSNEILNERYDAIVIDEAQDFSDEYWFAIEELLRDPDDGYMYVFIDQNQALYRRHANLPVSEEPYLLTANCRNTAPIHELAYRYYSGEPIDGPDLAGPAVELVRAASEDQQADAVVTRVKEWLGREGLLQEDIVVLVAKQPKTYAYDLLRDRANQSGISWGVEERKGSRSVLVDTVARFKGLESPAIVLWVGDEVVDERSWETVYVGTTRAKSLLCVVGTARAIGALSRSVPIDA